MNLTAKIGNVLNLRPEEIRVSLLLFSYAGLMGIVRAYLKTAAMTLFLESYSADDLPFVYILISVTTVVIGIVYLKASTYFSTVPLGIGNWSFVLVVTLLFWGIVQMFDTKWIVIALPVWYIVVSTLMSFAYWGVAMKLIDVRQGKRIFPLVGTGDYLMTALGGLSVSPLVKIIGTPNLLLLAGGGVLASIFMLKYLSRVFQEKLAGTPQQAQSGKQKSEKQKPEKVFDWTSYTLSIAAFIVLSNFVYFFVDNAFNDVAKQQFPDPDDLAGFLGNFAAIVSIGAVALRFFIAGRLLNRYGLIVGLIAVPAAVLIGATLVGVSGAIVGSAVLVFWLMTITQLLDYSFRGIQYTSVVTLYKPLMEKGAATQATMDGVVAPITGGVTGVFLLLLRQQEWVKIGVTELCYFLIPLCLVWLAVTFRLNKPYREMLSKVLGRRQISEAIFFARGANFLVPLEDKTSLMLLEQELKSRFAENVIYALDLLEDLRPGTYAEILIPLLGHDEEDVRLDVLRRIEKHRITEALEAIQARVAVELSAKVRGVILKVKCSLSEEGLQEALNYLSDEDEELRHGALTGLLQSGDIEGLFHAGGELMRQIRSDDPAERIFAAKVLGESGIKGVHRTIANLLEDPEISVRQVALEAAGKLNNPLLWPRVVKYLSDRQLCFAAVSTLIHADNSCIPSLAKAFEENPNNEELLLRILRIAGLIGGKEAIEFLWGQIQFEDEDIRHVVMLALKNCGFRASEGQVPEVQKMIAIEVDDAIWTLAAIEDTPNEKVTLILKRALGGEFDKNKVRIFLLFSFVYSRDLILKAWNSYIHGSQDKKAYALELLETVIPHEMKSIVFPLLEDLSVKERLQKLEKHFPQKSLGWQERIKELLGRTNLLTTTWTKCCVLYLVGKQGMGEWSDQVVKHLEDPETVVQETAIWALAQLDHAFSEDHLSLIEDAPSQEPFGLVNLVLAGGTFEPTIEKVGRLRAIELFAQIPEYILAELVPYLEDLHFPAKYLVFEKGDEDNSMYMILDGRIRVHDEEKTLYIAESNDVIGDFTILDPGPRTTSITTMVPTRLFRLRQEVLYDLMSLNVEVTKGLIQSILRKLLFNPLNEQNKDSPDTTKQ